MIEKHLLKKYPFQQNSSWLYGHSVYLSGKDPESIF